MSCDNITVLAVRVQPMIERITKRSETVFRHQRNNRKKTLRIKGLSPYGYTAELLLWKKPVRSFLWLFAGTLFYFLAEVAGYSTLTLISYLMLSQLTIDTIVFNFMPLLKRVRLADENLDRNQFLNEGRFVSEQLVDRAAKITEVNVRKGGERWKVVVSEASADNVLIAMRNISYCFTPFSISTLMFIAFVSAFSIFVTYEKNKQLIDKTYTSFLTTYHDGLRLLRRRFNYS